MASLHSFYLEPSRWRAPFVLDGAEAHHLGRVLRIKAGATVRMFDGKGRQGLFVVEEVNKSSVSLLLQTEEHTPPPAVRCTLAAGFSKALRRGWFLEKAVELEAWALWLWQGDYSQAKLPAEEKLGWRGALIAGAKQCRSAWLPELAMLKAGVRELIERRSNFDRAFFLYEGDTQGRLLAPQDLAEPGDVLLIIGPEGGFSPGEVQALMAAGIPPVSMGDRILRWETAAVLALGLAWWARQRPSAPELPCAGTAGEY